MGFVSHLPWSAVFAGVFIAIAIQLLLSLLGLSIGFGSINPVEDARPFSGLWTGALIWWIVTTLISFFDLLLGAVSDNLSAGAAARKREAVIVHTVD